MNPLVNETALVDAWLETRRRRDRDALVVAYQPLVEEVAQQMSRSSGLSVDELMSHGQLGLLSAIEQYADDQGVRFHQFAAQKIRWAVTDGRREFGAISRGLTENSKLLEHAAETLRHRLHHEPSDNEIAGHLRVSVEQVHRMREDALVQMPVSLDTPVDAAAEDQASGQRSVDPVTPEDHLMVTILRDRVAAALASVSGVEGVVLALYYQEGLTMPQIARELGVAVSMISSFHTAGVRTVQAALRGGQSFTQ